MATTVSYYIKKKSREFRGVKSSGRVPQGTVTTTLLHEHTRKPLSNHVVRDTHTQTQTRARARARTYTEDPLRHEHNSERKLANTPGITRVAVFSRSLFISRLLVSTSRVAVPSYFSSSYYRKFSFLSSTTDRALTTQIRTHTETRAELRSDASMRVHGFVHLLVFDRHRTSVHVCVRARPPARSGEGAGREGGRGCHNRRSAGSDRGVDHR